MATSLLVHEAFNAGDIQAINAVRHPSMRFVDRRSLLGAEERGATDASFTFLFQHGVHLERPELLVSRGPGAVLIRWEARAPGSAWTFLNVLVVDDAGLVTDSLMFDASDRRAANEEL